MSDKERVQQWCIKYVHDLFKDDDGTANMICSDLKISPLRVHEALEELVRKAEEEEISEMKVLLSAAGYYIGREYLDKELGWWCPYDRLSGYYKTYEQAFEQLTRMKQDQE